MRASLVVLLLTVSLLLAGCASSGAKGAPASDETKSSGRSSRAGGSQGVDPYHDPRRTPQDPDLNTTLLEQFNLRLASGPGQGEGESRTVKIGGNYSMIRVSSVFYINSLNPIHSGRAPLMLSGGDPPPTNRALWDNGSVLVDHVMRSNTIFIGSTGYMAQQSMSRVADIAPSAAEARFATRGWGDGYVGVTIESVHGVAETSSD